MQKYKKLLWILSLLILVLPACRKDQQNPTNLVIQVVDDYGNPQSGASVTLYQTQYDYNNNINVYASAFTDQNGNATFNNINAIIYFYYIDRSNDCLNNNFTTYYTPSLSTGVTNNYPVVVNETGFITFNNNSPSGSSYQISINNVYYQTLNAGYTIKDIAEPTGTYTIVVTQVGGTNTETFYPVVTACGTVVVNFP